jgi:proteasome assembly chaperone (PAC2) family protein
VTVHWESEPALRRPILVAAFRGWNDAGNAASDAVRWLARESDARPFARLDAEEYLDFQAARPVVELLDGAVRGIEWPSLVFSAGTLRTSRRDVVLLLGVEPNLRWRQFCDDILGVARRTRCETIVTLGALLGDVPHSRPVRCTGSATDDVLMAKVGLERSTYEGPTGIVGVVHDAVRRSGFAAGSLWAPVPHYVSSAPSPKATRALLGALDAMLDLGLDLTDLDIAAAAWERSVAEVVAADSDVAAYVAGLESRYDDALAGIDDLDDDEDDDEDWFDEDELPSGETLAQDIEQFLRDQHPDD